MRRKKKDLLIRNRRRRTMIGDPMRLCHQCGAIISEVELATYGLRCEDCFAVNWEMRSRIDNARKEMTAKSHHVPAGVSLRICTRQPGCGEGEDYFGNHT